MKPTSPSHPGRLSSRSVLVLAASLGLLGGCAISSPAPQPLSPETTAAALTARTLHDEGLRRFLVQNLGHEPSPWPLTTWDFETLSWAAFYSNPSLDVARAQWEVAHAGMKTAAERPNPTVSIVPGYNTTREPGLSPWFPAINFDFLLQNSAKRTRQQAMAGADAEAARLTIVSAAWQVRSDLRHALVDTNAAENRGHLLRSQVEMRQELLALLSARLAVGHLTALEISVARTALLKAEVAAAEAENQAAAARARVATALGLPVQALDGLTLKFAPPAAQLTSAALADARRQSLQSRADILAALAHYRSAQAALELEVAKQQPDFHLGPGYQWDQGANKWSLGLTFELPLFHRNNAGPVAEAVARRSEAAAQFIAVQAQAIAAIDAAAGAQAIAAAQYDRTLKLVAGVQQQTNFVQQRFDRGAADRVELLTSRLDLADSDIAGFDSARALASAAGQLEDALQVPFANLDAVISPSRALTSLPSP